MALGHTGTSAEALRPRTTLILKERLARKYMTMSLANDRWRGLVELLEEPELQLPVAEDITTGGIERFRQKHNFGQLREIRGALDIYPFASAKKINRDTLLYRAKFHSAIRTAEVVAAAAAEFPGTVAENAYASANQITCMDGQTLASASHLKGSSTQANLGTTDFSDAELSLALTAMFGMRDINDKKTLKIMPNVLMYNPAQWRTVKEALGVSGPDTYISVGQGDAAAVRSSQNVYNDFNLERYATPEVASGGFVLIQTTGYQKPITMNSPHLLVKGEHPAAARFQSIQNTVKIWYDDTEECAKIKCIFDMGIMANANWEHVYLDGAAYGTILDLKSKKGEY